MRLPRFLRKLTIIEELILTIFTYKWEKCVKSVGKYLLESLILQGFQTAKNRVFRSFLPYFLHILEALPTSHITKKRINPCIFYVSKTYYFFL